MKKHKAYKFRIYPNKDQEILIAKTIGCSREWTCPSCGIHHDRDVNAGLNLKQEAEHILASSTVGTTGLA